MNSCGKKKLQLIKDKNAQLIWRSLLVKDEEIKSHTELDWQDSYIKSYDDPVVFFETFNLLIALNHASLALSRSVPGTFSVNLL